MHMAKKYYSLTIFCDGATPDFLIDDETLRDFEDSFESGSGIISFADANDSGQVRLRNWKLTGYKKTSTLERPIKNNSSE